MAQNPSFDRIRQTARHVTGSSQFQAHQLAVKLEGNPQALQLAQAIEQADSHDVSHLQVQQEAPPSRVE